MTSWKDAPLVALDLEGSGAQDRDDEAILEIAVVPIQACRPSMPDAYSTLINPSRPIPRKPWISPGLTSDVLAVAPQLADVAPELAARLNGKVIIGHNIGVDWRLLHRRCPAIQPEALIDTLRLTRHINPQAKGNSLTTLLDRHSLTGTVTSLVPGSSPHRALWDTTGTALLLVKLIEDLAGADELSLTELVRIAGYHASSSPNNSASSPEQASLLDI